MLLKVFRLRVMANSPPAAASDAAATAASIVRATPRPRPCSGMLMVL